MNKLFVILALLFLLSKNISTYPLNIDQNANQSNTETQPRIAPFENQETAGQWPDPQSRQQPGPPPGFHPGPSPGPPPDQQSFPPSDQNPFSQSSNNEGNNGFNPSNDVIYENNDNDKPKFNNSGPVDEKTKDSNEKQEEKKNVEKTVENNKKINTKIENKSSNRRYLVVLPIIGVVIIALFAAIKFYKKKHFFTSEEYDEMIESNEYMGNMNVIKMNDNNVPPPPLINFSGFGTMNSMNSINSINSINSMNSTATKNTGLTSTSGLEREVQLSNGLGSQKENEQYNKSFGNLNRGLKPPPARDTNNKKKNVIKVKNNPTLVINTKRKSKNSDASNSIARTSTDLSLTPTRISNTSSGYIYSNNKMNKHSSVALTFGCQSVSDSSYNNDSSNITNIPSFQTSNTSSRVSSQKSLTSFLSNSTHSFKNRISYYLPGRKNSQNDKFSSIYTDDSSTRYSTSNNNIKLKNLSISEFGDISNTNTTTNNNNNGTTTTKSKAGSSTTTSSSSKSTKVNSRNDTSPENSPNDLNDTSFDQLIKNKNGNLTSFINDGSKRINLSIIEETEE